MKSLKKVLIPTAVLLFSATLSQAQLGVKAGVLIHPMRLACTGNPHGPSLYHLLEVLGTEKVLQRIGKLKKQAAVAHNPLSWRNALQDLRLAILAFAQFHVAPAKLVCAASNIDKRLVIVIAQNGCVWHCDDICD